MILKKSTVVAVVLATMLAVLVDETCGFVPPDIVRRFEYKLSFKGPHLIFKDGSIAFWEHAGSAIASNDQVRLTPSIKSQKGRAWCKNPMGHADWEVEVTLRINGRGRIGADGMAIWYTDKIGTEGPVFGSNDNWVGLGVFLDSFDNDAQQNNPYIMVMNNDGTASYEHHRDGITQQLGGCLRDFRNKPFPVKIKLEYYKRVLTVYYHAGLNDDLTSYEICARVENLNLPANGYFGVSAETGGLADDQDVLSFITHSLVDRTAQVNPLSTDEEKKYDQEYQDFMKQLEEEKLKYNKEHPEKLADIDEKKNYEAESDRQFRNILDVQNSIHQTLRALDSKMAEIVGRQERIVSQISTISTGSVGGGSNNNQPNNHAQVPIDTIRREEVTHIITQQNEIVRNIRDIYASVSEVQRKTNVLQDSRGQQQPQQGNQANIPGFDPHVLQQINDGVRSFKSEMSIMLSRNQVRCPELTGCVSTMYLLVVIVIQTAVFMAYFYFK